MNIHRGHCRCGQITVEISGAPVASVFCHCDDCRRSAGAPLIAAVAFAKSDIVWTVSEAVGEYTNGSCTRLFCRNCGSPVAQIHEIAQDRVYFNTGFMDRPQDFPPTGHAYSGEQLPWLKLNDDLPRAEATVSLGAKNNG